MGFNQKLTTFKGKMKNIGTYKLLKIEEPEIGIMVITIDRPQALNALNLSVFNELKMVLNELAALPVRGIILTGSGTKAFVAGADISEFSQIGVGEAKQFLSLGNTVMNQIESFKCPIVAAIQGFALGGGCELAMACHLRIAGEQARFGMPEVNLGILPGYGGTQRLPLLVGKAKAMELMLTGEMITANEALSLGLVNHVVPSGEEIIKAIELLKKIIAKAPLAVQHIITAVNASSNLTNGIESEGDHFTTLADTQDFKEGVSAFLSKRKPEFNGL